jgi:arylsulfatase
MLGTRGLWHEGWKAVTVHGPTSGIGHFDRDQWQLFHTDEDRAEAHDLAAQQPDKVKELVELWYYEAGKNNVLPLDDRTPLEILGEERPVAIPAGGTYTYYPGTQMLPERLAADTHGRSFKILAEVEITEPGAEGVLMAQGSRFGGQSLFIKDRKLYYVHNFLGIPPEQEVSANGLEPGKYVLGMEFVKESVGQYHESHGKTRLYINDEVVAEAPMQTMTGHFSLCGEGLCIGYDGGDAVSKEYSSPFPFSGGRILKVEVNVGEDKYADLEQEAAAMLARE